MNTQTLIPKNEARWSNVVYNKTAQANAAPVAKRLVAAKKIYQDISNKTGVPWFIIAVIHEREASQRWDRNLAQGDPWNKVSTHVPKGRGPFSSFVEAAIDALKNCPPKAAKWTDWSAGGALTLLELYNGIGYENRGIASPYLWSGTNQYTRGKYVADNVFDATVVDKQLGCVVLLDAMHTLDASVSFGEIEVPTDDDDEPDVEESTAINAPKAGPIPDDQKPAVQSTTIWASIGTVLTSAGAMLTDWKVVGIIVVAALAGYIIWQRQGKPDIKGLF